MRVFRAAVWLRSMFAVSFFLAGGVNAQALEPLRDIVSAGGGFGHTCALSGSGRVHCWGSGAQLGRGSTVDSLLPVVVPGIESPAVRLAQGGRCVATQNGNVYCWGYDATLAGSFQTHATRIEGLESAVAVANSLSHSCAALASGAVKCWGSGSAGELGNGTTTGSASPVAVIGLSGRAVDVAVNNFASCALLEGGTVMCWGANSVGTVGDGTFQNRSTATAVAGLTGVRALSAGGAHVCALTASEAFCWGNNGNGQLGLGTTSSQGRPVAVPGFAGAVALALGAFHSCAVFADGRAACAGSNLYGQLGNGTQVQQTSPVQVQQLDGKAVAAAAGERHSCAILATSEIQCWGFNDSDQLGDGKGARQTVPLVAPAFGTSRAVAAGYQHTCALGSAGGVTCAGDNTFGQLGDGTNQRRSQAVAVSGLASGVVQIAVGLEHACALTDRNSVSCWGNNSKGQLGDGTSIHRNTPVAVTGFNSRVTAITAGGYHTCALSESGLLCWGDNADGQLGDGTGFDRVRPAAVQGLDNARAISAGGRHTCAITNERTAKCWGRGSYGQLGDGARWSARFGPSFPVVASGSSILGNVASISAGWEHSCAVLNDQSSFCWGRGLYGELGNGRTDESLFAVPVRSHGSPGERTISAGGVFTCGTAAGAAFCWGDNGWAELGDGTVTDRSSPTAVSGLVRNVRSVSAGYSHACALSTAGAVSCWGLGLAGQLSDGRRNYGLAAKVLHDRSTALFAAPSAGAAGTSSEGQPDASGDLVVFASTATNLVPGDDNQASDIFVRRVSTNSVVRASVGDNESQILGASAEPSISADGHLVVFVAPDAAVAELAGESAAVRKQRIKNTGYGVFLRNLLLGTTQRLGSALPAGSGTRPVLAPSGNAVVYTGLPASPSIGNVTQPNVFTVEIARSGRATLPAAPRCQTCKSGEVVSDGPSRNGVLSADGTMLAFETEADNLATNGTGCGSVASHVLLRNVLSGANQRISAAATTLQCAQGGARNPSIDWSGTRVAFESDLPLVSSDTNVHADVFLFDAATGGRTLLSVDPSSQHEALGPSTQPSISGDGSMVSFQTEAANVDQSDSDKNETNDIVVRAIANPAIRRVSRSASGLQGDDRSAAPKMSFAGTTVTFGSLARNLIMGSNGRLSDANGASDIFQAANPLAAQNKSGTWWIPAESGWGLTTVDQGSAVAVAWFTYDSDGEPTWFVGAVTPQANGRHAGALFRHNGVPLGQINGVAATSVVKMADVTLDFSGTGGLSFEYVLTDGRRQTKALRKFQYGADDLVCRASGVSPGAASETLSDIWWAGPASSGWGVIIAQPSSTAIATWYTYDVDGEAVFYIASAERQGNGDYSGPIFRQRNGVPFTAIDNTRASASADAVGTASFRQLDNGELDFTYSISGVTQTKRIVRYRFGNTPAVCTAMKR